MEEIAKLEVQKISDRNCVLFLWVTVPLLPSGLKIMELWGFEYKTSLFWRKIMSLGMGFWFRGQVEILIMGLKGKLKAFRIQRANFIESKVQRHSQKPDGFYELIEMTGLNPKIELFARKKRLGWDVWGNEVESNIELGDLKCPSKSSS